MKDEQRRPNFVVIMTDTQGANLVGCYGHPELRTPNIDRLAAEGIRFDRAYTTCPLCTPARAAIFSGIYAHTSGPWTNNLAFGDNIITMGQRFSDNGYDAAYIGKWHLDGHDYFGTGICPKGWDERYWYDGKNYLAELSEAEITLWRQGLNSYEDLVAHDIQPEFTWANRISNRAVDFLSGNHEQPFVLAVSYDEPHHPQTCPPEYVEPFLEYRYPLGEAGRDTLEGKPEHHREWAAARRMDVGEEGYGHPLYFGCNSYVDTEIGRVIDAARACPNTCIVYTSDHGSMMGTHGLDDKGAAMYDGCTRIPFIVRLPDGARAGTVDSAPLSQIHLMPTMMDMAGIERPPILEGDSLAERWRTGEVGDTGSAIVEFNRYEIEHDSFGGFQPIRCIVQGDYKLVINLLHTDELYNMAEDPDEVRNLIDDAGHAQVRDELHDALLTWMYEKRDPFRGYCWERRPWRSERRLNLQWQGKFRARPADGYAPVVLDYDTGLPARGPKVEYGK